MLERVAAIVLNDESIAKEDWRLSPISHFDTLSELRKLSLDPERTIYRSVTPLLAAFLLERGQALPGEWITVGQGGDTADLHPDIRFLPMDVPPGD